MSARLVSLSIDANDPAPVARFWAALLRWDVDAADPDDIVLVPTDGNAFPIRVRRVPGRAVHPSRVHLDLTTESQADQDETVALALKLGGSHLDIGQTSDEGHVVLADPEGNELCIIEPGNRFLGDCGRLGAVNCDGSQATGYFWAAALDWPLVWDQDEETAIRAADPARPSGLTGPVISWGGSPVNPKGVPRNRLHLDLAPADGADLDTEVIRLLSLGAVSLDPASGLLADPDDNELTLS